MKRVVTIIGSGMMGSALAFPARENGHEVRLVGTHLDREIIQGCRNTGRHPKFTRDFPAGVQYYQIEELEEAGSLRDISHMPSRVKCAVLGWHTMEELVDKEPIKNPGEHSGEAVSTE